MAEGEDDIILTKVQQFWTFELPRDLWLGLGGNHGGQVTESGLAGSESKPFQWELIAKGTHRRSYVQHL
jgi:hypothetical protein